MPARPSSPTALASTEFARRVHESPTEEGRFRRGVEQAVALLDGCDHASVTVLTPHYLETVAASDDVARRGDVLQYELSQGPCLDSVRSRTSVVSQDLEADDRWRDWAPRAADGLGVRATLTLLLGAGTRRVSSLNLYADRAQVWDDEQQVLARVLADQLAVAVADARLLDERERAVLARTGIGQAQGIVMERFGLDVDEAFELLSELSRRTRVELVHLAEHIVETRQLPRLPDGLLEPER